jgi:hypothetical protein
MQAKPVFCHYTSWSSKRQDAGNLGSSRLVTPNRKPCRRRGCTYQGERGAGAKPKGRAREAISTSDINSGSNTTTARPAVACTVIEPEAISPRQRSISPGRVEPLTLQTYLGHRSIGSTTRATLRWPRGGLRTFGGRGRDNASHHAAARGRGVRRPDHTVSVPLA